MAETTEQRQHTAELDARVKQLARDMDGAAAGAPEIDVLDEQLAQQAERVASEPGMRGGVSGMGSAQADSPAPSGESASWIAALGEDEFTTIEAVLGEVAAEVEAANAQRDSITEKAAAGSAIEPAAKGALAEAPAALDGAAESVDVAAEALAQGVAEKGFSPDPPFLDTSPIAAKPVAPPAPRVVVPPPPDVSPPTPVPVAASPLKPMSAGEEQVDVPGPPTAPSAVESRSSADAAGQGEEIASIEQLDEALAANAENAVETAPAESPAPAPTGDGQRMFEPAPAVAPSTNGPAAEAQADRPSESVATNASPARSATAEASSAPPKEVVEAKPGVAPVKRGGVTVILARALSPLANLTANLPVTARQTIGYAAATTLFNAACLWGFIAFRGSAHDAPHSGTGVKFLHPGDAAPAPTPHKASAAESHGGEAKDAGHGKEAEGHGKPPAKSSAKSEKDAHGKSGAADAHGKTASAKPAKAKSAKGAAKPEAHGEH